MLCFFHPSHDCWLCNVYQVFTSFMNFDAFWESKYCLCISFGTATLHHSVFLWHESFYTYTKESAHIYTYRAIKKYFKIILFGWEQCCNEWCNRYAVLKKGEGNTLSWAMPAGQIGTVHWMSVRESYRDYQKASILRQSLMFLEVDPVTRTMLLSCSTESFEFSCSFDHSHLSTLMLHKKTGTRWKTQN